MRWLGIAALIVVVGVFETWVELAAQNHPARVFIVGGVVFLAVAAVLFLFPSGPLIALALGLAGGWGWGIVAALDARDNELGFYCKYGAQSKAELEDCMASVTTDDIDELDTPAARFARGETRACGRGSGRYCAAAAKDADAHYVE